MRWFWYEETRVYRKKPDVGWGWVILLIVSTCVGADQGGAGGAFIGFFVACLLYGVLKGD